MMMVIISEIKLQQGRGLQNLLSIYPTHRPANKWLKRHKDIVMHNYDTLVITKIPSCASSSWALKEQISSSCDRIF
jgi:hypothetical protein